MGCGSSSAAGPKASIRVLLLGGGGCGKTTFVKQMKLNYRGGFSINETNEVKQKLRSNILQRLVKSLNDIESVSEESQQAVELLRKAASQEYEFMSENGEHYEQLAKAVVLACDLKEIQEYKAENYFLSPWDFDLFDSAQRIFAKGYEPSHTDILMCRSPATGLHEYSFSVDSLDLIFIDVGGQRKERATWAKAMENIGAVIYVASLAEYGQHLEEDNVKDRMVESLELFQRVFYSPKLAAIPTVLLLNKFDLLEQKLQMTPLTSVFADYDGPNEVEPAYEFISKKFIERMMLKPSTKDFVCQRVSAIDQGNFMKVFQVIKAMLISSSLRESGLG